MSQTTLDLHSWRRLDWRFLLPLAESAHLGLGGRPDADLAAAARLFDADTVDLAAAPPRSCDVVFLAVPDRTEVRAAVAALKPGGWLCVEVVRGARRPLTLRGWRRLLRSDGLIDTDIFWHVPTLASSTRIVPIASAAAVRSTLARHQGLRFGRFRSLAARLVLRSGLFGLVVPEGTVVGRIPGGGR